MFNLFHVNFGFCMFSVHDFYTILVFYLICIKYLFNDKLHGNVQLIRVLYVFMKILFEGEYVLKAENSLLLQGKY